MSTGSGSKTQQQTADRTAANTAITTAAAPTEWENYVSGQNLGLIKDLNSGKDVKDISALAPYLNLYNSAVNDNQNYAGEGLLSQNELSGGNGNMIGAVGQQLASRRKQAAQGDLYNSVQSAQANAMGQGMALDQIANQKSGQAASLYNSRVNQWIGQPQQPGLLSSIITGGLGVAGSYLGKP